MAGAVFKRRDMTEIAAREDLNAAASFSNDEESRIALLAFTKRVFVVLEGRHVHILVLDEA